MCCSAALSTSRLLAARGERRFVPRAFVLGLDFFVGISAATRAFSAQPGDVYNDSTAHLSLASRLTIVRETVDSKGDLLKKNPEPQVEHRFKHERTLRRLPD
jgi:hypothetical protein